MNKIQERYPALFEKFEPELIEELLKLEIYKFEKDYFIPGYTEIPTGIPLLLKGKVDITLKDSRGQRFKVYTISEGESCIITMNALIRSTQNKGQEGWAMEYSEIIMVSGELSLQWIGKYPGWRKFIFDLYGKRLEELLVNHDLVADQKDEISRKNKEIQSSIVYASKIQNAVLHSTNELDAALSNYFIFNRPKDIVSGDFYWQEQVDNKIVIAAADATGHGVPGAFMSLLGVTMLNDVVKEEAHVSAGKILTCLREKTKAVLKQSGEGEFQKDGYDIALCIIDIEHKKLEFAGAYNPLYLIRSNELIEIKADKMPVGIHLNEKKSFTTHLIDLKEGDCIYMFSDGFIDQFGGKNDQKFKIKPFKELLRQIHNKPFSIQESILSTTFDEWKGKNDQTDDVLVVGLRI